MVVAMAACQQRGSGGGSGQRVSSATVAGMAVAATATTMLSPRAATVAMKTLAATATAGAQATINNELKGGGNGRRRQQRWLGHGQCRHWRRLK